MAAGAAYVEELAAYSPAGIAAACKRWAREQARWPSLSELLAIVEDIDAAAQRKPVEDKQAAWQVFVEAAVGTLPSCFLRRIGQLERGEHARFGRELADFAMQWKVMEIHEHGKAIEAWVSQWLGVTWRDLMGEPPAPIDKSMGRRSRPPMPDLSGFQRVVVEPEREPA